MYTSDIKSVATIAQKKAYVCNHQIGTYFARSVMAGFFIVVATILSNVTSSVLYPTYPQFGKLLGAFLFSIAIVLIVFIGGELFTGNNMTMTLGVMERSCTMKDLLKVWGISYIGNFVGILLLSVIFVASGASKQSLIEYYNSFIMDKLSIPALQLLLRGILCNFLVCLAVWTGIRMKSESGKIMVMFCIIMTFVVSGFEHCIANMSIFTISSLLLGGLDWVLILRSMAIVTLGNIIGGAVLFAVPIKLISGEQ